MGYLYLMAGPRGADSKRALERSGEPAGGAVTRPILGLNDSVLIPTEAATCNEMMPPPITR
jgi:hypothetical protein